MSVLDGPREEWRRIFHEGQPKWAKPDGDALLLGDGRAIHEAEATSLPPCGAWRWARIGGRRNDEYGK